MVSQRFNKFLYISIEQTYKLLNLNTLKNAIQLIIHARNIYLIGIGGSGLVCTDFMHKLTRVNHNVIYHEDLIFY